MTLESTFVAQPRLPDGEDEAPASAERFGRRWRLVGAGLSNVWRYGDLVMDAASGRLLMRGPNGTGKTTALEVLWPYLLDLNERVLGAGKARQTTLTSLMREGAQARRRVGYVWLSFVGPAGEGELSYGVRLQFSEGSSPPVTVIPFGVPGRPLRDLALYGAGRATLTLEEFRDRVAAADGQIFAGDDDYVADLAARLLRTNAAEARACASRIRQVRNPNLLGDLTPKEARDALRDVLPGVSDDVVTATAEALAESAETRNAFDRDRDNADVIADFAQVWTGHVAEVVGAAATAAREDAAELRRRRGEQRRLAGELGRAEAVHADAKREAAELRDYSKQLEGVVKALENSEAFKAVGALTALEGRLQAELRTAKTTWEALASAASEVRGATTRLATSLDELAEDVTRQQQLVAEADPSAPGLDPLVAYSRTPRAVFIVGNDSADPGPALTVTSDVTVFLDATTAWRALADRHAAHGNTARLALDDHKPVAAAAQKVDTAEQNVAKASERVDDGERALRQLTERAGEQAHLLVDSLAEFADANRDLVEVMPGARAAASTQADTDTGAHADVSGADGLDQVDGWTVDDISKLRAAEPGQVLAAADELAELVAHRAADIAAQLRAQAKAHETRAGEVAGQATGLRSEAKQLREGKLLALPRAQWAGLGDDDFALGAALDWRDDVADADRDRVELALASAGLLGATLGAAGAATRAWEVTATGAVTHPNLTDVLAVDPQHPLANPARAVLERVALRDNARDTDGAALVIGRDGTFRAGVATGAVLDAVEAASPAITGHVGARQRRAAALARADVLGAQAEALETEARELTAQAKAWRRDADAQQLRTKKLPARNPLRQAETQRAGKATEVASLTEEMQRLEEVARQLRGEHRRLRDEWVERVTTLDLPADVDALTSIESTAKTVAATVRKAASEVADRFAQRFARLHQLAADDRAGVLAAMFGRARTAADEALSRQSELDTLRETTGEDAEVVMERHRAASAEFEATLAQLEPMRKAAEERGNEVAGLGVQVQAAGARVTEAEPWVQTRLHAIERLLDVPGVVEAVFDGARPEADEMLAALGARLAGVKTYTKLTLRQRYDEARARLAGAWTLSPGDPVGDLDTFSLSFEDGSFNPVRAAAHARAVADKAEAALAAADEKALREFVVGLLPSAIRTAWVRMHDWSKEVNRKMRSAAASSQLSVQVRVELSDDLSEHSRTVYELACKTFEGDRTPEQDAAVGRALQALINAADGETMAEKVAVAVNIRDWVDVTYVIRRPDGTTTNWTSRTGLSGGERRLVVLAPMLAAIAANYDRFGDTVMRVAALDEVPAEVDERGREGLARYLAKLDLDLICTSYLWDGAPGAWDGIDAWDLEAADDSTVVGFPMLVRGLVPLPGDTVGDDIAGPAVP